MARLVPDDALVLDVGANYGQSVVSFKTLLPRSRIHSFEPNPSSFEELRRLASAYDDVEVHQVAVGAERGRIELSLPVVRGVVFHQLASVHPMSTPDLIRQLHTDGFRWARARDVDWRTTSIEVVTLDSFGFTPGLVKIDVEGGEPGVLDGARATLRALPVIVVERGLRPEVRFRLEPLGYRALEWRQGRFEPAVGATLNTYFVGNSASPLLV